MEKIVWDESYSVGVREIDEQHQKIIGMVNNLIVNENEKRDIMIIADVLTNMSQYALHHFKTEEQLMESHSYPECNLQKTQHKEFRIKLINFCTDANSHKEVIADTILIYLKEWWINHILKSDMEYKEFFNEKGVY